MYKSILLPVDDSEQSYSAVELAGVLSCGCGAMLTLFHVRRPPQEVVTDMVTEDKLFALPLIKKSGICSSVARLSSASSTSIRR